MVDMPKNRDDWRTRNSTLVFLFLLLLLLD